MRRPPTLSDSVPVILLALCGLARARECMQTTSTRLPVVSMCENGTREVASAYLSAFSTEMGDGTRCTCTLKALSELSNGSSFVLSQNPWVSNCSASLSVRGSSVAYYTCNFTGGDNGQQRNTSDVTIEVLRNKSDDFGFCLAIISSILSDRFNLTCENDATYQNVTTPPETGSGSSTVSLVASPSARTLISSVDATAVASFSGTAVVTEGGRTFVLSGSTTENSEKPPNSFPIIPVAAGVTGALVFILIVIIVVVVNRSRRRKKARQQPPSRWSKVPVPPDIPLEDNILYESSSASPAGDAPKTRSATHPVEDKTGGSRTSGKTRVQPGRGQYLGPAGDLYSLVQKPREDGGPEDASSAQRHSTAVDALPADDQRGKDDPASQLDMAATGSSHA